MEGCRQSATRDGDVIRHARNPKESATPNSGLFITNARRFWKCVCLSKLCNIADGCTLDLGVPRRAISGLDLCATRDGDMIRNSGRKSTRRLSAKLIRNFQPQCWKPANTE